MSGIKGLRTLVRLKTRRVEQCEAALLDNRGALAQQRDALEALRLAEAVVRDEELGQRARLASTFGRVAGFRGDDIVTLQLLLKEAERQAAAAAKETERGQARCQAAEQKVLEANSAVQRSRQQLERTAQRLQDALAAQDRAQEDAQDEEAEETAVARMIARTRGLAREHARRAQLA